LIGWVMTYICLNFSGFLMSKLATFLINKKVNTIMFFMIKSKKETCFWLFINIFHYSEK